MSIFLEELSKQYSQYRIVMLLDKAGRQTNQLLNMPDNIKLMHQCPYSTELNPVELHWREIRAKYFHNETLESLDNVADTLEIALKNFYDNKQAVKTISNDFLLIHIIDSGILSECARANMGSQVMLRNRIPKIRHLAVNIPGCFLWILLFYHTLQYRFI